MPLTYGEQINAYNQAIHGENFAGLAGGMLGSLGGSGGGAMGALGFLTKPLTMYAQGVKKDAQIGMQNFMQKMEAQRQANTIDIENSKLNNPSTQQLALGGPLMQPNVNKFFGPSHDQGGIQIGNNEVEGEETRGMGVTANYIFSDRLKCEDGRTFAEKSMDIDKKYKGMENDRMALEAKDKELQALMEMQEDQKRVLQETQERQEAANFLKNGGPLQGLNNKGVAAIGKGVHQNLVDAQSQREKLAQQVMSGTLTQDAYMQAISGINALENQQLESNTAKNSKSVNYPGFGTFGKKKLQFGGGLDYPPIGMEYNMENSNIPVYPVSNGGAINNTTSTMVNPNLNNTPGVETELGNTSGGVIGEGLSSGSNGGIYDPINFNENDPSVSHGTWFGEESSPDILFQHLAGLGIPEEQAKHMAYNQQVTQGYFDYIKPDQEFFNQRKSLHSDLDYNEAFGNKMRHGPHHMKMYEYNKLMDYFNLINQNNDTFVPPIKGVKLDNVLDPTMEPGMMKLYNQQRNGDNSKITNNDLTNKNSGVNIDPLLAALPNLAQGIGNFALARNYKLPRATGRQAEVDYVDPTRAAQEVKEQYAYAKDQARQLSTGAGNYLSNLIGMTAGESRGLADVYSKYGNINAGIFNQAEQFNANQWNQMSQFNTQVGVQEKEGKTQLYQNALEGLAGAGNNALNTYFQQKRANEMMKIAGGENYGYHKVGNQWVPKFRGSGYEYYIDPVTKEQVKI